MMLANDGRATMNEQRNTNDRLPEVEPNLQATAIQEPDYEETFGLWMDAELEKLVARWIHLAAPNASRSLRRTFGK
jgi:hypothetical protein